MKFLIVTASFATLNRGCSCRLAASAATTASTRRRQNSSWQGSDRKVSGRQVCPADRHQRL